MTETKNNQPKELENQTVKSNENSIAQNQTKRVHSYNAGLPKSYVNRMKEQSKKQRGRANPPAFLLQNFFETIFDNLHILEIFCKQ